MHAYFIKYVRGLWGGNVMIYECTGIYQGNPYMKSTYIFISWCVWTWQRTLGGNDKQAFREHFFQNSPAHTCLFCKRNKERKKESKCDRSIQGAYQSLAPLFFWGERNVATHCNSLQRTAMHCNALQCTATQCNALQCNATHIYALQNDTMHCNALHRTATNRSALQNAATPTSCDTLQHTVLLKKDVQKKSAQGCRNRTLAGHDPIDCWQFSIGWYSFNLYFRLTFCSIWPILE